MDPTGGLAGWGLLAISAAVVVSLFIFPFKVVAWVGGIVFVLFVAFVLFILSNARYT